MDERKLIYADDAIEAIDEITWYHQNINNEMVRGANSSEDQAWYKAEDVYEALEQLPSVQPEIIRCKDCKWCEDADGLMCKNPASWVVATDYDFGCVCAERRQDG